MNTTLSAPGPRPAASPGWAAWGIRFLVTLWIAAGALGGWALFQRFTVGKELAAYSSYVPWGLWVAMYIYFSGLSAGAFLLSTLVYVFRVESLRPLGRLALWTALVSLLGGMAMITLDLGHPERALSVLCSPNFSSMMAWMVWLYAVYFVLLVALLWLAIRQPHCKTMRGLAMVGLPLAVIFSGGVGALFGVVGAQPGWNSGLYPLLFLTGAVTSGAALLLFLAVTVLGKGREEISPALKTLRRTVQALLLLDALFLWSELSIGYYASIPGHHNVIQSILFGPYWYNFWLVQVGLGLVVPLVLLTWGKARRGLLALAGLLVVVGFVGMRLNLVVPELVSPNLAGLQEAYRDQRLRFEYFPSLNEWAVTAGLLAFVVLVFYLGWRFLPLQSDVDTGAAAEQEAAPIDAFVRKRRGWLAAAGAVVAGLAAGWGIFRTRRKPRYATGGDTSRARLPLPVVPAGDTPDVLYQMQADLDRALGKPMEERRWGMVIDTRKCIGCHACTVSCVAENRLPPGVVYRPVVTEEIGQYPNVALRFVPRPCMQCENPPCVPVCPVLATYSRPDGIVEINYDECIGCRYCLTACPYNARTSDFGDFYTAQTPEVQPYEQAPSYEYGKEWNRAEHGSPVGNARKCHFCLHRLERGMLPECVTSCVGRATFFGDLSDPNSLVAKLSNQPNKMVLLEHLGTKPRVTYLV
jgi:molybdopterin-containing oxidoreductase family iron-sulfur binding subunit